MTEHFSFYGLALEVSNPARARSDFGRVRPQQPARGRPGNCRQLAETAAEEVEAAVRERDLSVGLDLRPATVMADRSLLERLATNLLQNAARYNIRGGGIAVSTVASDGRANLTVVNDGPRVSQAEAETLTTFRRLGAGRTGSDGFGLGLSIADSVARAHGGTLTIRARGGGLAVTVELPATAGDPALERAPTVVG